MNYHHNLSPAARLVAKLAAAHVLAHPDGTDRAEQRQALARILDILGIEPASQQPHPAPTPEERRSAATADRRAWRDRVAGTLPPDDPRHGKASTYTNWRCRCPRCTAANTAATAPRVAARRARLKAVANDKGVAA